MKRILLAAFLFLSVLGAAPEALAGGDRVTMKDGAVHTGDILFQNGDVCYISSGSGVSRLVFTDIARIDFGGKAAAPAAPESAEAPAA